ERQVGRVLQVRMRSYCSWGGDEAGRTRRNSSRRDRPPKASSSLVEPPLVCRNGTAERPERHSRHSRHGTFVPMLAASSQSAEGLGGLALLVKLLSILDILAERQGFEPWVGSPPQRFSRPFLACAAINEENRDRRYEQVEPAAQ